MIDRVRITGLERTAGGHWRARVTFKGRTYDVDRIFGSWQMIDHNEHGRSIRREVLPHVAALLQARVRKQERREQRGTAQSV